MSWAACIYCGCYYPFRDLTEECCLKQHGDGCSCVFDMRDLASSGVTLPKTFRCFASCASDRWHGLVVARGQPERWILLFQEMPEPSQFVVTVKAQRGVPAVQMFRKEVQGWIDVLPNSEVCDIIETLQQAALLW